MKVSLLMGVVSLWLACSQAIAGNYILTIDGKKHEVDLTEQSSIELSDGKKIQVTLEKKTVISFKSDSFSFDHPSDVTPSRTAIGNGIYQTMMTTPLGTLIIIQEYTNIDPSSLVDMMLNELTKEEKQYGYTINKTPAEMQLESGIMVTGKKAVASYRGKESTRYVLCHSLRDAGTMVITMIDKDATPEDQAMIETFWKTLKLSQK